ncbi:hypothetical protein [Leifsonia xyli]|uniref:hypothetical protein n=1 Tax=Leifsonia xyli TaxID=1575 RepID=UPI003D66CC88
MPAYLITYDLNSPGQKYEKLSEKIKAYGTYVKLMESTWMVSGYSLTAQGIYDNLSPVLDKNDNIFVVNVSGQDRQGWLDQEIWDWIRKNV